MVSYADYTLRCGLRQPGIANGSGRPVECPVCGGTEVHPAGVVVNPAGQGFSGDVKVFQNGVHIDQTAKPEGRGVLVMFGFGCDNGHQFALTWHLEGGETIMRCHVLPDGRSSPIWKDDGLGD